MESNASSAQKIKVTTSLDAGLVKNIDEYLKLSKARSRSQLIENILRNWHMAIKKRELESQIEEYYLSSSKDEIKENREWNKIAAESAKSFWGE